MTAKATLSKKSNSRGAAIFKKMMEDKQAISKHVKKGRKIAELKDNYKFAKLVSAPEK